MVPRAQRRGPVLGGADRPGRHPGLRRLVPARGRAPPPRQRAGRLRLRRRPARPGRRDHPAADRRPGPALDRGRGVQRRRPRSTPPTLPDVHARGAALRPRGRLRHRRGLRPGRRGPRRLGRPARGAGRRRRAALRGRRGAALPGQRPRAGPAAATSRSCWARVPAQRSETDVFEEVRRAARAGGHGRAVRGPGRAARRAARRGQPTTARPPRPSSPLFGDRARSWSARWPTTSPRAHVSARAALSAHRAAVGLAGGAAPGAQQRPAARARPRRRRPRPPPPGRGDLPAAGRRPAGTADRDARGVLPPRLVARGHRPGALRAPQHRALPAAPGRRADRLLPHRRPGRVHARRSRWCSAGSPDARADRAPL